MTFILSYALSKIWVLFHVREPRFRFWLFEIRYSAVNLINTLRAGTLSQVFFHGSAVKTINGNFRVRPGTQDAALISPAFERRDQLKMAAVLAEEGKKGETHFIDVGANIGAYSVRAARAFPNIFVHAFEPVGENRALLVENLKLNGLSSPQVEVYPFALSDQAAQLVLTGTHHQGGNFGVRTKIAGETQIRISAQTGDEIFKTLNPNARVVLKIDVEGLEIQVLNGFRELINRQKSIRLCVEDALLKDELNKKLIDIGFVFETKLTPYNSWWKR